MDKKLFKSLMLLITFTVLLILAIIRFDWILQLIGQILELFRPLFIGFAIAFVLKRPCDFFCKLYDRGLAGTKAAKASRPLAVTTSYLVLIGLIAILFSLVVPQLAESINLFLGSMSTYIKNSQNWINAMIERFDWDFMQSLDLSGFSDTVKNLLNNTLSVITDTIPQIFTITSTLISAVVTTFIAIIFSIYMLAGEKKLLSQLHRIFCAYLPEKITTPLFEVTSLTADIFTRFISGQLIEACILASLCFIGMTIFRFQYAPLISVLVGVCALIPIAGAFISATVSTLLLLMISPAQALWFLVFLIVLQQLEGNLIYPRVVGTSIGLPAIWVLAAITVGGGLFGFIGILVSVPVASVLYALLKRDLARRAALKNNSPL